ncbi:hypothetical protein RND71_025044 [Anisodus tanguticus]|uniref:Uncharacterized protein n=1 Tax=Anisodus tanguticus TaxID=243964 RepID=A0AAE1RSB2_9SOLA|nr:hypothetical protein RND71_025044 [Anisodus tanguticus]
MREMMDLKTLVTLTLEKKSVIAPRAIYVCDFVPHSPQRLSLLSFVRAESPFLSDRLRSLAED